MLFFFFFEASLWCILRSPSHRFLPHVLISQMNTLSRMRRTHFDLSCALRSVLFFPFLSVTFLKGLHRGPAKKKERKKWPSEVDFLNSSTIYEQYKKGHQRVDKHFPLSLSGNFTLGYVQTTSEAGFFAFSSYTLFFRWYDYNFIMH